MHVSLYIHTIYYILLTDLKVLSRTLRDKLFDTFIWVLSTSLISIYLLPYTGVDTSYGAFMIAGVAASVGGFEQFASATQLVSDLEGNKIISFYFTLPMPSLLVFVAYMSFYFVNTIVISIGVIPVCKILFWNYFSLTQLSLVKYTIILILSSLFNATFTLWLTGMVPSLERIGTTWMRFVYPLWIFGGFQYSYQMLAKLNIFFAYASLLNPLLYVTEGTRAAVLGQEGYLNFWLCCVVLILFSVICVVHALRMLKKRLDFV